jgi:Tfp pilus assembly protein PilP
MRKWSVALIVLSIGFWGMQAQAQAQAQEDRFEIKKETYTYRPDGRRDPFVSLIDAAREQEVKKKKGLSPVEDYDISQINLSAIIWDKDGYFALVGLPDGKHYTIKEGMSLGIYGGKVVRITSNAVVVREKVRDYRGRVKDHEAVLRLRAEEVE